MRTTALLHNDARAARDLPDLRVAVERRLAELLPAPASPGDAIAAAMHAAVMTPGKRLRPLLALAVGQALGSRSPALLDLACAVEMVHCASLVLDDMPAMDNARLRRGEPTIHLRYGEDVAMLAGVALVTEACRVAASVAGLRAAVRARAVQVLCEAVGPAGLVRGQYRDLREGAGARSANAMAEANAQKTGVLFAAAMEIGARAAGAPRAVPALRRAALAIGHAFQLRDDLDDLDEFVDGPATEDPWQDEGKSTLARLLGRASTRDAICASVDDAVLALRTALPDGGERALTLLARAFPEAFDAPSPLPRQRAGRVGLDALPAS